VLRNLAGLQDADALADHEAQASTLRLAQLAALRLEGAYDLAHQTPVAPASSESRRLDQPFAGASSGRRAGASLSLADGVENFQKISVRVTGMIWGPVSCWASPETLPRTPKSAAQGPRRDRKS